MWHAQTFSDCLCRRLCMFSFYFVFRECTSLSHCFQKEKEEEALRQEELRKEALEMKSKLDSIELVYEANIGKNGAMIGTVSNKTIAEDLKSKYGIVIDKRKFIDHYLVNCFGITNLRIELFKDVIGTVKVRVKEKKK